DDQDGFARLARRLLEDLASRGHDIHALAPALSRDLETTSFLRSIGVSYGDVPFSRTGRNPFADLMAGTTLYRRMAKCHPDLVLSYTVKPVIWGTLTAALLRVPDRIALVTGLGFAASRPAHPIQRVAAQLARSLLRFALGRATLVIFQNPDDLNESRSLGILPGDVETAIVDGSGVDLDEFEEVPLSAFPPVRFLTVARLLGAKGIRELVAAARMVHASHPEVEFHLVGGVDPGPDSIDAFEVHQWAAEGALVWHGNVSDVRPHLAACHAYVLPSYREGLPRSSQEAMATGRAVITTDVPGCRETVVDGVNGWLVAAKDPAALAGAMERMILNPDLLQTMGCASRRIAEERFDVHRINRQMLRAMGC
ncbi:MAG TPA: glycosyltransferase family 4 protein, partial [Gemmatimonadales bacterium]|nr:glycosyltransferase family 4 protein [Gemmatimonadales bacterium]